MRPNERAHRARRVAARIDADGQDTDVLGAGAQCGVVEANGGERARAEAVRIEERQQHHLPACVRESDGSPVLVVQSEIRDTHGVADRRSVEAAGACGAGGDEGERQDDEQLGRHRTTIVPSMFAWTTHS